MKRPIALLFCLMIITLPLAGCIDGQDTLDDSVVTELENQITMQDDKIAELEAEIANLTVENQLALADLAVVQSTLQATQTSLEFAQSNITMHETVISSLEIERDNANAQISILNELMNNMSDQSNETSENMTLQISELNQHINNLSSMLNESNDRHQENISLVNSYSQQISSLNNQLVAMTIAYEDANFNIEGKLYNIGPMVSSQIEDILKEVLGNDIITAIGRPGTSIALNINGPHAGDLYRDTIDDFSNGWYIDITIGNEGGIDILNWSDLDFSYTVWERIDNVIACSGPNSGSQWALQCINLDNTSFVGSEIGEFDGATLRYADFSDSSGTYLRFRNTNMTHAVFANSNYESGWFNNADLTYTDFSDVTFTMWNSPNGYRNDFSNSNLSYSNFNDASLYGLTFANADLTGATFIGTTFVGNNVWSNTICPDGTNSDDNGNTCMNNL